MSVFSNDLSCVDACMYKLVIIIYHLLAKHNDSLLGIFLEFMYEL